MAAEEGPKQRTCAQMVVHELLVETKPEYRARRLEVEEETRQTIETGEAMRVARKLIKIPVVVHVVHATERENVSDAQVKSQIAVLNKDFRAKNSDKSKVPSAWKSLVADANIEFALATKDPKGKKTTGITRTATSVTSFGANDEVKSKKSGGVDPWPTDRYLNVWVCNLGQGLLGYAQFPGGPAKTDGVVILYTAFGTKGAVKAPFNKGRTATHEIGHYLGLRHIWGDRNDCSGNDFVADTPPARQANMGKPKFPRITCNNGPNGDMFMNYMDYVDDDTMYMFTEGQVARMNATLAGPRRKLAGL
ncbi:MAG TPA: zinc metalloprotease [Solirubrobacterales bacterium]|nr:zinc metalloprotease [Solirubrobacterales bacterium]